MGRIEPKDRDLMDVVLGNAQVNGNSYWCGLTKDGNPIVENHTTGKVYIIGWEEIILAAIAAGIDKGDSATPAIPANSHP
jgi:hypothetical protein